MGKWNKKRPSSNLLVGQEYYVITLAQICSSHRWSSRYIGADDSFRDAIWSCCRFSVRYLTSDIAWAEMGMQLYVVEWLPTREWQKKVIGSMAPFPFPTWLWTNILAGWCEISLHWLLVAIPVGRWGTVVFTFSTITLSVGYGCCCRQCLVGLQLSTVWLPTKPYLCSKRGLVGMLLSINWFYE